MSAEENLAVYRLVTVVDNSPTRIVDLGGGLVRVEAPSIGMHAAMTPAEPERFSGGVNLSAAKRNELRRRARP